MRKSDYTPSVVEACIYLKRRYAGICLRWPLTSTWLIEAQYVATNLKYRLRNMREFHEENHASDCARWIYEPCDCETAKRAL